MNFKTAIITLILVLISLRLFAQINGSVLSETGECVEYATIYNTSQKTSCITNINGNFQIKGIIGDTIEIKHLNFKTRRFAITNQLSIYTLIPENFIINEVVISAKEAALLFEKSCKNTYVKLRDFEYTRGYCRYLRLINRDTTQLVDLDLDIIQRKGKKFEKGSIISPVIVQERILENESKTEEDISYNIADFYPHINAINWVKISNDFNYYKVEDSLFIQLYFLADKHIWDLPYNYEVKIFKLDTCLSSITMSNKNNSTITNIYSYNGGYGGNSKTIAIIKNRSNYVEYKYESGYSFLSGFSHQFELLTMDSVQNTISIDVMYKTYNSDASKVERRFGYRIFENKLKPLEIQNRHKDSFWENNDYIRTPFVDYERILQLTIDKE